MFSSGRSADAPDVLRCSAADVQPGDEVIIVDPDGAHLAVHPEYVIVDPDKTSVTFVPRDGEEHVVDYGDPVMVVRGEDLSRFIPSAD